MELTGTVHEARHASKAVFSVIDHLNSAVLEELRNRLRAAQAENLALVLSLDGCAHGFSLPVLKEIAQEFNSNLSLVYTEPRLAKRIASDEVTAALPHFTNLRSALTGK